MRVERALRALFIVVGGALLLTGLWKMHYLHPLRRVTVWAVAPALLHDGLLAPAAVVAGFVGSRVLPRWVRAPLLFGALASLSLLLIGLSVVTRSGARADNPSLLPRDYWHSEVIALAVVWACVAVAAAVSAGRARRQPVGVRATGQRT